MGGAYGRARLAQANIYTWLISDSAPLNDLSYATWLISKSAHFSEFLDSGAMSSWAKWPMDLWANDSRGVGPSGP